MILYDSFCLMILGTHKNSKQQKELYGTIIKYINLSLPHLSISIYIYVCVCIYIIISYTVKFISI